MQNAGIQALDLNWRYLAFDVPPDRLHVAIQGARALRFIGLNLTVPHKLLAVDMVDLLDESARTWGAVNTIRFEAKGADGTWRPVADCDSETCSEVRARGFNTDADAIIHALREDLDVRLAGARVLLLGAGGAGRVAALRMAREHPQALCLVNRTQSKADDLAAEIRDRHPSVNVTSDYPSHEVDLLLNATSLGLNARDPLPFDRARFDLRRARAVYDMVYRPATTSLLRQAAEAGCRTANGLGMLLHQGAKALEIWSGRPAPIDIMRRALTESVYGP
jgi:shikimate dehydrogenase